MQSRPILAVTMGDPVGVGPEVVLKALSDDSVCRACRPLVIGCGAVLMRYLGLLAKGLELRPVAGPKQGAYRHGAIDMLEVGDPAVAELPMGQVSARAGEASIQYVLKALDLCRSGAVHGMVTAPINKEACSLAGYTDLGHMELLARLLGVKNHATMLATGPLRVVHLTTHLSLAAACKMVTRELVLAQLRLTHDSFVAWGYGAPRIGVAALNPHGGEAGLLGREEIDEIAPAVAEARAQGINALGPYPADSIFVKGLQGEFDAILAMHHDQGHIPIKVHGFEESVSVALGLPILRTSVDHGTAFDIAGKGVANHRSMVQAILVAAELAAGRAGL